jgi:hypothetical protein
MAKKAGAKKKKARKGRPAEGFTVIQNIGQMTKSGVFIDLEKIETLIEDLTTNQKKKIRFVALNAPFMRRSAITSS